MIRTNRQQCNPVRPVAVRNGRVFVLESLFVSFCNRTRRNVELLLLMTYIALCASSTFVAFIFSIYTYCTSSSASSRTAAYGKAVSDAVCNLRMGSFPLLLLLLLLLPLLLHCQPSHLGEEVGVA